MPSRSNILLEICISTVGFGFSLFVLLHFFLIGLRLFSPFPLSLSVFLLIFDVEAFVSDAFICILEDFVSSSRYYKKVCLHFIGHPLYLRNKLKKCEFTFRASTMLETFNSHE